MFEVPKKEEENLYPIKGDSIRQYFTLHFTSKGEISICIMDLHCWSADSVFLGQSFSMNVTKCPIQASHSAGIFLSHRIEGRGKKSTPD